jgi:hypothetical protein
MKALRQNDRSHRKEFPLEMLNCVVKDNNFLEDIIFSFEAILNPRGVVHRTIAEFGVSETHTHFLSSDGIAPNWIHVAMGPFDPYFCNSR